MPSIMVPLPQTPLPWQKVFFPAACEILRVLFNLVSIEARTNQLEQTQSTNSYALASLIWKFHFVASHLEMFYLESGK